MNIQKLIKLLKSSEGPKLDFKAALHLQMESDKKELVKDVSAIANSKGGRGYILFGIEDKTKKILGINVEEDSIEERIQQIICNRADPPIPVRFDIFELENKKIGVLTIFRSDQHPHQIRQTGSFYIRRGSTTDVARRQEIADMLQEVGIVSSELIILKRSRIEDLDKEALKFYLDKARIYAEEINTILLEGLGIIAKSIDKEQYYPTLGGMLLFGKQPENYLPHVGIQIIWENEVASFKGNLISMLDATEDYIEKKLQGSHYPKEALYEVIENAVVHRDYWDSSQEIIVKVGKEKIEISNPGALWTPGSIHRLIKEDHFPRRNPWLYQRLLVLDKKNRFLKDGFGVNRIKQVFQKGTRVKFINITSKNIFKVELPGLTNFLSGTKAPEQ